VLRVRGVKLIFNLAGFVLQATVAIVVFRLVLGHGAVDGPLAWLAAAIGAVTADFLSHVLVTLAVWLHTRVFQRDLGVWTLLIGSSSAIAKTAIALLAVVAIEEQVPGAVVLLVVVTAAMYIVFRAYASLYLRHQRVEKLYQFTRALAGSVAATDVSEHAVLEARELLSADAGELVLLGAARIVVSSDGASELRHRNVTAGDRAMIERMAGAHAAVAAGEGETDPSLREWLAARHWGTALIAPLGTDGRAGWLAVGRTVDDEPFDADDTQLLEAMANHANVALENVRLVDELSAEARERERRALHDPLTELPNRVHLTDELTRAMQSADADARIAVLVFGLDDFREINETLGHDHGDEVLREVAFRLGELAQGTAVTARLGGDEFAMLVTDARGVGAASRTADLIVRAFEENPFHVAGLVIELGVRVGVALYPEHGSSALQLLRRGEIALRAARSRHARVNVFMPGDDPDTPRQLIMAHDLRGALESGELTVFVQPQLDLATRQVRRGEILLRWTRDGRVYLTPDEFIPVAERTGLIRPLTQYVLQRALEHRRQWTAEGYEVDISVNASVRDLVDPAFPEQVAVALTRAVCPAHALTLEITETQIMSEPERVAAALRRLAVLGVQVSIDDFGTGYSSLSSVRALAVDELKIDKSFVRNAAEDQQDGTLVKSITELGHGLGMRVVAEGVEDDRTLDLLRNIGVDIAQGFEVARPMPAVDLPGWLARIDERRSSDVS